MCDTSHTILQLAVFLYQCNMAIYVSQELQVILIVFGGYMLLHWKISLKCVQFLSPQLLKLLFKICCLHV